jgi:hypothetical protein
MAWKPVKNETVEMKQLFEIYYAMGDARSYRRLSEEQKVPESSIKRYSRSFNWSRRIEQRDLSVMDEVERRTHEAVVYGKSQYRQLIGTLTERFSTDVHNGKIRINSVNQFVELVRLDLELMGEESEGKKAVDNLASALEIIAGIREPEKDDGAIKDGEDIIEKPKKKPEAKGFIKPKDKEE